MKISIKQFFKISTVLVLLSFPAQVLASDTVGSFLANRIIPFATQLAIAGAVMMVVFAGFVYITSGGNPERAQQAKQYIEGAVLGLITMLSIGLIIKTIYGSIVPGDRSGFQATPAQNQPTNNMPGAPSKNPAPAPPATGSASSGFSNPESPKK